MAEGEASQSNPKSKSGDTSFVAGCLAAVMFVCCLFLAAGLIGALIYAGTQRSKAASIQNDMDELQLEMDELQAQMAEYQRRYSISDDQARSIEERAVEEAARPGVEVDRGEGSKVMVLFDAAARVAPAKPITEPTIPFPEPEAVGKRTGDLVRNGHIADGLERYELPYQAQPQRFHITGGYSPLTFNADNTKLYFVDGNTVLRRLNLEDLVEERKIVLGAICTEVAMSAGGLVAALPNNGVVWGIDPETLAVRYEIELTGATRVASSPALGMAFAVGETEAIAFDAETGEVHYREKLLAGSNRQYPGNQAINKNAYGFHITPDGQYAYSATGKAVHQFKIVDGVRMIYQGKTADINSSNTQMMSMSRDGSWVSLSAGGGLRRAGYAIGLFETDRLDTPSMILQTGAYPGCVEWDLTTGNILANNFEELLVCSPRGQPIKTLKRRRGSRCQQIVALPIGDRFILWTEHKIAIWDLQPGRLHDLIHRKQ
jgi:hypothetical protein